MLTLRNTLELLAFVAPSAALVACGSGSASSTGTGGTTSGSHSSSSSSTSSTAAGESSSSGGGGMGAGGMGSSSSSGGGGMGAGGMGSSSSSSSGAAGCPDLVPALPTTSGPVFHVSPTGKDTNDGSSAQQAFSTLSRALENAQPGTRVLLGDGTYAMTAQLAISNINGTAAQPIVITPETGATPVFDFSGASLPGAGASALTFNGCTYFFVDGITVANSPASGVGFNGGSNMTLTRSTIHDVQGSAIMSVGSYFVIAGNETYNTAMVNANGKATSWPGTVMSWYVNGTTPSSHIQYLQNHIHDAWGECLITLFADGVDVIGNDIHDCWAVGVYVDHGSNVRVLQNRLRNTVTPFNGRGTAISIEDESYSSYPFTPETNILVAQNYLGKGFTYSLNRWEPASWAAPGNTWSHLHIVFNVFEANTITWTKVGGGTAPSDGVLAGNIFLGSPSITIDDAATAWTIAQNDFVGGVPSQFAGNGNFSVMPTFVGPTDGSTLAGFAVTNASALAVDARPEVPEDAFCATRTSPKTTAGLSGP